MQTANGLRGAWRHWLEDAEALLPRLPPRTNGEGLRGLQDLRLGIGFARGLIGMPPEEVLRRHQRVRRGEAKLYTTEEARPELGLAPRR